ncbi:MAG: hypothetical protein GEU90_05690 [Gemmatimonas sp.]|nr:hypothetical protein [Gemmatimonas sp.]
MRRRLLFVLLAPACLSLPACRGGPAPVSTPAVAPVAPSEVVFYDNSGGIRDSLRVVVRDESTLREFWESATSTQLAPPPMPAVDFGREMVLVIGAGRMTPADQLQVDSVGVRDEPTSGGGRQRVLEAVVRTIQGCQEFNADAYPVVFLRVQRFDGTVRFTERRDQSAGCDPTSLFGQVDARAGRRRPA